MADSGVDIEPTGHGCIIRLPNRELGGANRLGWAVIAFAAFVTMFMLAWIATPVSWGIDILNKGEVFGWLFIGFGCLGLGGLFFAIKAVVFGVAILQNRLRCEVIIDENKIVSHERFGWFGYKTKIKREKVRNLFIAPLSITDDETDEGSGRATIGFLDSLLGSNAADSCLIRTEKRQGRVIAPVYSREILESVATAITTELNRNRAESVLIVRDRAVDGSSKADDAVTVEHLTEQDVQDADYHLPADSTLQVMEEGESTVYRIPERNLKGGSGGLFMFSVLWNGFMIVFTMMLFAGNVNGANGFGGQLAVGGFVAIFWAVGIGMLLGSIYTARQSAMIGVKDGLLFIERKTIFGTKWTEFEASQIESIKMGHSNVEVNNVPVMNLQIKPRDAKANGMFAHLDNQEIKWLSQQLTRSLGIKAKEISLAVGNFDSSKAIVPPVSTDIVVSQEPGLTTIRVPAWEMPNSKGISIAAILFMLFPIPLAIGWALINGIDFTVVSVSIVITFIAAVMFLGMRVISSRKFFISATADTLTVQREGFLSNKDYSIVRPGILKVDVVDSGVKIDSRSLSCLEVKGRNANSMSIMTGRDDEELIYVARLIHQRMQLSKSVDS